MSLLYFGVVLFVLSFAPFRSSQFVRLTMAFDANTKETFCPKKKGTEIEVCFLKTYADFNAMDISS